MGGAGPSLAPLTAEGRARRNTFCVNCAEILIPQGNSARPGGMWGGNREAACHDKLLLILSDRPLPPALTFLSLRSAWKRPAARGANPAAPRWSLPLQGWRGELRPEGAVPPTPVSAKGRGREPCRDARWEM